MKTVKIALEAVVIRVLKVAIGAAMLIVTDPREEAVGEVVVVNLGVVLEWEVAVEENWAAAGLTVAGMVVLIPGRVTVSVLYKLFDAACLYTKTYISPYGLCLLACMLKIFSVELLSDRSGYQRGSSEGELPPPPVSIPFKICSS